MPSKIAYPWFFFYRIARLTLIVFIPTLFIILFLYRSSYKSGLVSQMSQQIKIDLLIIKHTLNSSQIDWTQWCNTLPKLQDMQYIVFNKDGTITCDTSNPGLIGKKTEDFNKIALKIPTNFSTSLNKSSIFGTQAIYSDMKISEELQIRKVIPISSLRDNMDRFDRVLFLRIVPFAILSYFIFIWFFYNLTKPLGVILTKVEKFKDDVPFSKSLALLYKKDEWGTIEEALNKADQKLQNQVQEVKTENEKNTAILESINDDIIAIDKYESILFHNTKFKNNFILMRTGLEIEKKIWHIFDDEVLLAFRSVLKTGTPSSLKARNFPHSNNPNRFFDLTITPLVSSNGLINGALGVFYDVTEFKLTEQMRVDFVANVSHEIRTPLTSIKGFSQILMTQTNKVDVSLHPFLNKIVINTERMISLFNDLLSLSVIESQNNLKLDKFSFSDLIESTKDSISANYPSKNIIFKKNIELDQIIGDVRLIEQVVLNLSDNACKYSEKDVEIHFSCTRKDTIAQICIKDNGPGIAKEHLPRIFERFYRVDASRESLRGTGIGLSIVKQIISKHKGKIWAESEGLGFGTTFVIELPLEKIF